VGALSVGCGSPEAAPTDWGADRSEADIDEQIAADPLSLTLTTVVIGADNQIVDLVVEELTPEQRKAMLLEDVAFVARHPAPAFMSGEEFDAKEDSLKEAAKAATTDGNGAVDDARFSQRKDALVAVGCGGFGALPTGVKFFSQTNFMGAQYCVTNHLSPGQHLTIPTGWAIHPSNIGIHSAILKEALSQSETPATDTHHGGYVGTGGVWDTLEVYSPYDGLDQLRCW
jgi:hypothetical protein